MRINIYSPTYFRFNKTQKAISTIIETVNSSKHDVKLYLCDNNSPHEMKLWLLDQDVHNERVVTYLSPINYGKASIVNTVHGAARQSDYIASIDSDMLNTHDEYNWIDEMIDILIYDTKIGVISAYQEGANCHKLNLLSKTYFVGKNKIIEGNYKAVAGGCFMMRAFEFDKIKGYTVSDIYSGDDASIMKKCHHILKKKAVVCETVALQHMLNEENENAYQAWKIAKARGEIPQGENTKGFYDI